MAPDTSERRPSLPLKDAALLRNQCYIDGRWCDADSGATFDIVNPASAAKSRQRADDGRGGDRARHRSRRQGLARLARQDCEGALGDHPQVVRAAARSTPTIWR